MLKHDNELRAAPGDPGMDDPKTLVEARRQEMILFKRAKAANKRYMRGTGTFEAYQEALRLHRHAKGTMEFFERYGDHPDAETDR